jgi:hypothetical protein
MKSLIKDKFKNYDNGISNNSSLGFDCASNKEALSASATTSKFKSKWAANSNRIKNAKEFSKNLLKGKFFDANNKRNSNY